MRRYDSYTSGLLVASVLRVGLYIGLLAVFAMMAACSPFPPAQSILPSMSADADINRREGAQTRNDEPLGGCHEKSDSSLRKPLS